jgi:drug/metabolite transporter (DMT)-like permease
MWMSLSPNTQVIFAVAAYSFCSGSLVLVNKLVLHHLPYPSLVITFQLWAALIFIQVADAFQLIDVDPVRWKNIKPYLAYTVAFSLGVYCNMKSLSMSNVETVIVFRALSPLLVSVADALFLGREWPSARSWTALSVIAAGAYGYAMTDEQFKTQGIMAYFWPTLYLFVISFEMAYGKKIISGVDLKTRSGPVLYTNMLGWPPMLGFAWMGGEYSRFYNDSINHALKDEPLFSTAAIVLSLLGCVVGTGIGYSGWYCRDKVSAASYTLIGVINKCLTVLVNLLIWDNHASMEGIASLSLCLVGGVFYQQAPMKKEHVESPAVSNKDEEGQDISMTPLLRRGTHGAGTETKL